MNFLLRLLHDPLFSVSFGAAITGIVLIFNYFAAKHTKPNLAFSITLFGSGVAMMTFLSIH